MRRFKCNMTITEGWWHLKNEIGVYYQLIYVYKDDRWEHWAWHINSAIWIKRGSYKKASNFIEDVNEHWGYVGLIVPISARPPSPWSWPYPTGNK